jgi:hypothetical protein
MGVKLVDVSTDLISIGKQHLQMWTHETDDISNSASNTARIGGKRHKERRNIPQVK